MPVRFRTAEDYPAAVNGFKAGEPDLVCFGGLTGVQARQQVPQAHYIPTQAENGQDIERIAGGLNLLSR